MNEKKRFAVGEEVRVTIPGMNGVITQLDDKQTFLGQYWHAVRTQHGERREPGSNLEPLSTALKAR
jgi:heat shock protein HspQ